ncbi:MAG: SH3 beta-barrel fold-containing protein [Bacteroidaceae bacterium]
MCNKTREQMRAIMNQAWQFVKRNGFSLSEALRVAWANAKLKARLYTGIVKFYFQKIDGSIREAYGTLKSDLIAPTSGEDNRRRNDTVQVYFDTEKQSYRCFKKANLIRIA